MNNMYKLNYRFMVLTLFVCAVFFTGQIVAQESDTLDVPWWDEVNQEVIVNSLLITIEDDRLDDTGKPPEGRVYRLEWGGFYPTTERIEADFPLVIVGDLDGEYRFFDQPPILQIWRRADLTVDEKMIMAYSDLKLENLYILGNDDTGDQTHYVPIQIDASNSRHVINNVVFERSNFAIPAWYGVNNSIHITNSIFRNMVPDPHASQWWGRGVSTWADQDTIIVENNTFFNVGYAVLTIGDGAAAYVRFNHNTLVNVGRQFISHTWWRDAFITNNLLINTRWHGEERWQVEAWMEDEPRNTHISEFTLGALPARYGPEFGRRIVLANNAAWLDPKFKQFYGEDDIVGSWWITPSVAEDYFDEYEDMIAQDTLWLPQQPDFGMYPVDDEFIEKMWKAIQDVRVEGIDGEPYFWGLPEVDPHVSIVWPLPEDFSYTDQDLMTFGTDGLPLGDLNWFPDAKADFEANKDQYIDDIHDMVSPPVEHVAIHSDYGFRGTLGGDAESFIVEGVQKNDNPTHYAYMAGDGLIQWDFELEEEQQYDLNFWVHMLDGESRGNILRVNGVSIMDDLGWGSFVWHQDRWPRDKWTWTLVTEDILHDDSKGALTLPAGENTIELDFSWGWMNYAALQVLPAGNSDPVVELMITEATVLENLSLVAVDAPYTPNYFTFVDLGDDGSISWNITTPDQGIYMFAFEYQNTGDPVEGELLVDGISIPVYFDSNEEGTRLVTFTDLVELSGAPYTITLNGSQVNIDAMHVYQEMIVSVRIRDELPDGFVLEQNFPNPFNPSTTIQYNIPKTEKVVLKIYNILGQEVQTLVNEEQMPGTYHAVFDASHLASGVYFYRLTAGDYTEVKKMMFLK